MKLGTYFILLISSFSLPVVAEDICAGWENPIEPDMRMPESLFSKEENANAKLRLAELDKNSQDLMVKFALENFERVIKGYKLRKTAMETKSKDSVREFCEFYVTEAYYHD